MLFKSYFLEKSAQKALKPLLLDLTGSSFFLYPRDQRNSTFGSLLGDLNRSFKIATWIQTPNLLDLLLDGLHSLLAFKTYTH